MIERWRYLNMDASDAYTNMATDEAILWMNARGISPNTIRLYTWRPSAVSIGYFQSATQEVNLEACTELGVDVVRRITGGGAVYHDSEGELTYSVVVGEEHSKISNDLIESYRTLCEGLIIGLRQLNLQAEFTPINDITVHGRKISGNAQTRRQGIVLQHGTLLLKTDIPMIFRVLRVSKEKISDKMVKAFEDRVTTVCKERGREVRLPEVKESLRRGFEEALDIKLEEGRLNDLEVEKARELRLKYASREWIFSR